MRHPATSGRLRGALLLLSLCRLLVPARHRGRWLHEWQAELWYAHRSGRFRLLRALSAIPHAVALRWQETRPEMLLADTRYAVRQLRRSPGFTLLVVATLGFGIGANSLVYSALRSTVLSPLQLPDADRLVYLWRNSADSSMQVTPTMTQIESWREQVDGLEEIEPIATRTLTLTGRGEPQRLQVGRVSPGFFRFIGIPPVIGRGFSADEAVEGRDRVAVLGNGTWHRLFGDESPLGEEITLDDEAYVVIGVLPTGFRLQSWVVDIDVWTPLTDLQQGRGAITMARLAPGVGLDAVNAELAGLSEEPTGPGESAFSGWVGVARAPQEMTGGQYRTVLWSVQGAVLFVLLIAGANTASLLLVRGSSHRRELAIRNAVGAGHGRLVRQLLAESLLLSLVGGALGLGLAHVGVRALAALRPGDLSSLATLRLDPSILWLTLGLSIACGLLFGLVPALHACRGRLAEDLAEGGRAADDAHSGGRLRSSLVVAEVALATLLLVGAGLLVHSFLRLQGIDPGFTPRNVLALDVALPEQRYDETAAKEFWRRLETGIRTALGPALQDMAIASGVPPHMGVMFGQPETEDGPVPEDEAQQISGMVHASPSYFATLGIPFVAGGPYPDDAGDDESFVVINESLARKLWPEGDAVGRRLRFGADGSWMTVAGVVGDIQFHGLGNSFTDQQLYASNRVQRAERVIALRAQRDPLDLVPAVRSQVRQLEPDAVISEVATVDEMLGDSIGLQRFNAQVMVALALLAILLAVVGIYGVLSYSVARRTREMGVRLALGASGSRVVRLIAREGLVLVAIGLGIGLLSAIWLGRLLGSQLYTVEAVDPMTYAGVAVLFALVGLAATAVPAWRATRVDPVTALRTE